MPGEPYTGVGTHITGSPFAAHVGHAARFPVLAGREWLAGIFSVADILMADVLRLVDHPSAADGE
jgi:hypothetical protein